MLVFSNKNGSISKLSTASMKKLFNFSATSLLSDVVISFSTNIISAGRDFYLSEKSGFILCQNFQLSSRITGSRSL